MRNVQAYLDAGRNDPSDEQQMREHPYDFVSLPERPAQGDAVLHDCLPTNRWNGRLRLIYRTQGPLHIGSGFFETAEECGLRGGGPVRGIMRSVSGPVLPGSSWKGAIRARFEAITRSRLALARKDVKEKADKMPEALRDRDRNHKLKYTDPKLEALKPLFANRNNLRLLSPADALFGCMGYRGRILPGDGLIKGGRPLEPLSVAPLDSPQAHRLAKPGKLVPVEPDRRGRMKEWELKEVEGRKFYYDGGLVPKRNLQTRPGISRGAYDLIDWITPGAEIDIEVRIRSAGMAELGALLMAAGYGDDVGILRFGGYKSVGLGKVELRSAKPDLWLGGPLGKRHPTDFDVASAVTEARRTMIDTFALGELHSITTARRAE